MLEVTPIDNQQVMNKGYCGALYDNPYIYGTKDYREWDRLYQLGVQQYCQDTQVKLRKLSENLSELWT